MYTLHICAIVFVVLINIFLAIRKFYGKSDTFKVHNTVSINPFRIRDTTLDLAVAGCFTMLLSQNPLIDSLFSVLSLWMVVWQVVDMYKEGAFRENAIEIFSLMYSLVLLKLDQNNKITLPDRDKKRFEIFIYQNRNTSMFRAARQQIKDHPQSIIHLFKGSSYLKKPTTKSDNK